MIDPEVIDVETHQRVLQAERLDAIAQVVTGLSHETRNALQRIGASAEMLELELAGNAALLAHVVRIQQSQTHLHQILNDLRSYAAPVMLDRAAFRVSEAWREAWELLLAQRQARHTELREHLLTSNLIIEADRFRLVQVFRNLLENALAACVDPVQIDVTCKEARLGAASALRVSVRDNGSGLNGEQRRQIFEPFYTTKPTGTGLGMAIAQRIVDAHGGSITVGDPPPPGAEIIIAMPRQAA